MTQEATHCGVCEPKHLERNHYYVGKQFTVRDLRQEQRYFLDKMALTNSAILGWGVVCGLEVEHCEKDSLIVVHPGLALDCCGRQVRVCEAVTVSYEAQLKEHAAKQSAPAQQASSQEQEPAQETQQNGPYHKPIPPPPTAYALCLEYAECCVEDTRLPGDECGSGRRNEYNRIRDHFRLTLKPWDETCHARREDPLPCPDFQKKPATEQPEPKCPPPTLHSHLCEHMKCASCGCCACIVLAKVILSDPTRIDSCTHRRIVYTNSTLHKLIQCYHGDLAHIVDFCWRKETHAKRTRSVSWEWFMGKMRDGLTVHFDRPMDPKSISRHTFIVTVTFPDPESGRIRCERVPASQRPVVEEHGDCSKATFTACPKWLTHERGTTEMKDGFEVEITLHGSNIYSRGYDGHPGKALDGDFIRQMLPTGNGTPGGDFLDWFHVTKQPQSTCPDPPPEDLIY